MSISASVRQCLTKFKGLESEHDRLLGLEDEHGRFRVWSGNVAAHRPGGRRSLEYRLRDSSNLQSMVVSLLNDLLKALDVLQTATREGQKTKVDKGTSSTTGEHHDIQADSDDEDDAELFGVVNEDASEVDPVSRALEEIREINFCLLRFSMTLRNPARHDQIKESASTSTQFYVKYDIDHVQEKFPSAQVYLHERLGKAISRHRQYFKYRKEHHNKLAEGLDDDEDAKAERPSTIATSLNAPLVPNIETSKGDELETESLYSATSFAPTTVGDATLRPPSLPECGREGAPFECPLCFGIIITEDERSWRQHIYEDLPPYVCTYAECITANQRYSRRRDWQRHQVAVHNRHWICPYGCSSKLHSETGFQQHLLSKHGQSDAETTQQRLLESCSIPSNELSDLTCPLCQKLLTSSKLWMKHLGHHLEQLALRSVPRDAFASDSEDDSATMRDLGRSSESSGMDDELAIGPGLDVQDQGEESFRQQRDARAETPGEPSNHVKFEDQKDFDLSEHVSEELLPICNQLLTLKRCLEEVMQSGGVDDPKELYPYSMKLNSIEDTEKEGLLSMAGNDIPYGQPTVMALLNLCYDLMDELRSRAEKGNHARGHDTADRPTSTQIMKEAEGADDQIANEDASQVSCVCGLNEGGLLVRCNKCNQWQHTLCYYPDFEARSLPEPHYCVDCRPRVFDRAGVRARQVTSRHSEQPEEIIGFTEPNSDRNEEGASTSRSDNERLEPVDLGGSIEVRSDEDEEGGQNKVVESEYKRGPWSQGEDLALLSLVELHGTQDWVRISQTIKTRSPKQCRERSYQNLDSSHEHITSEEGMSIAKIALGLNLRNEHISVDRGDAKHAPHSMSFEEFEGLKEPKQIEERTEDTEEPDIAPSMGGDAMAPLDSDTASSSAQHAIPTNTLTDLKTRQYNFPCDLCGKRFGLLSDMQRHKDAVHRMASWTYVCTVCYTTFSRSDSVVRHCIEQHGESMKDSYYRRDVENEALGEDVGKFTRTSLPREPPQ